MVLVWLLLLFASVWGASPSYQQAAHFSVSSGYPNGGSFFTQQQGVLAQGPYNVSFQVVCSDNACQASQLKAGYYPHTWRLDLGYLSRFQSAHLIKQTPFFGVSFQYPNDLASKPLYPPAWRPWLGIRTTKSNQLTIRDATQTLFLGQVDPDYLLFSSSNLPIGSYPITITSTDTQGNIEQTNQFIAQPLYPNQQQESVLINIGWPVGKTANSNFGLPPIDANSQKLLAFASYARKWPLGFLAASSGFSVNSLQIGLRNVISSSHYAFAPELLWQTGPYSGSPGYNVALGSQFTWLPSTHTASQVSAYTYPSTPEDGNTYPSVVHTQITHQQKSWKSYFTWHWSSYTADNYWQSKISFRLPASQKWQYNLSLLADKKWQSSHSTTLRVQANQQPPTRNRLHYLASSRVQVASWSQKTTPNWYNHVKIGRYSQPSGPHLQGSWRTTWENPQGLVQMKTGFSQHSNHPMQWALEVDTGFSIAERVVVWHSVPSIWQSYIIHIPATPASRWFWWEDSSTKQAVIKPVRAYSVVTLEPEMPVEYTSSLVYPGNLLVKHTLT